MYKNSEYYKIPINSLFNDIRKGIKSKINNLKDLNNENKQNYLSEIENSFKLESLYIEEENLKKDKKYSSIKDQDGVVVVYKIPIKGNTDLLKYIPSNFSHSLSSSYSWIIDKNLEERLLDNADEENYLRFRYDLQISDLDNFKENDFNYQLDLFKKNLENLSRDLEKFNSEIKDFIKNSIDEKLTNLDKINSFINSP